MYDHLRSNPDKNPGAYDLQKCKHVACSEVRAALFSDRCKVKHRFTEIRPSSSKKEKLDAQMYCFKDQAIKHLKEKSKCSEKADKYVDFVFEQCIADKAPFHQGRSQNTRNFTSIL